METSTSSSVKEIFSEAEEAEKNDDNKQAIQLYKSIVATDPLNIPAYEKLMKLFRKLKEYKNELAIIKQGIKSYEAYYKMHKPKHSKKVDTISNKLNKSLGLVSKKGINVFDPEPLGKWKKRLLIVEKRIKK